MKNRRHFGRGRILTLDFNFVLMRLRLSQDVTREATVLCEVRVSGKLND